MTDERPDEVATRLAHALWSRERPLVTAFARVSGRVSAQGVVYTGVAGHTTTEGRGERDAAWRALVGELRARRAAA